MENDQRLTLTVSADGSGDCATISEALGRLEGTDPSVPATVLVRPGEYRERVEVRRPNLTIEGETAESVRVVMGLGAFRDAGDGRALGTFRTYTLLVDADDVCLRSLTIENDAGDGREVGQGIALYADGDRLVVDACRILGRQDTLFTGPLPPKEAKPGGFIGPKQFAPRRNVRQYYRRCLIAGDVDFVFGGATAYFEGCELRSLDRGEGVNGYVTAASTPEGLGHGYVFHGCSFTSEGCADETVYLGRPWRDWAKVALLDCWVGPHVRRDGWFDWDKPHAREASDFAAGTLFGPGAERAVWPGWTHRLADGEATSMSREAVLAGGDGWDPEGGAGDAVMTGALSGTGRTMRCERYLTSEPAMERRFEATARLAAFSGGTAEEWLAWRGRTRERLRDLLGVSLLAPCDLSPRSVERVALAGGIVREKVEIQVEEGVWMPVYLLFPARPAHVRDGRMSAFVCPHGHQGAGKESIAGVMGVPSVDDAIRKFNYDYGLRLARMGYLAVCPDSRGWGERREAAGQGDDVTSFTRGTCAQVAHMSEPLGIALAGLLAWDLMRLVDYLELRGDVRMDDLGCMGFSGGGLQAMWLLALDDRVRKGFVSGYLYGALESHLALNNNCACNYVPGLWRLLDVGDVASLAAPRPLVVQSCERDHLNGRGGLGNVEGQLDVVRGAYELLGAGDALLHEVSPGEHHLCVTNLAEEVEWLEASLEERGEAR